jgi:hypothetical protein
LHFVCVGLQLPTQLPVAQVWFAHAEPTVQLPVALQVSGVLLLVPVQDLVPDVQTPWHDPDTQVFVCIAQSVPSTQLPLLQDWVVLPLQPTAPGEHEPVQSPPEQTNGQAAPSTQTPAGLQVSGVVPLHCFVIGTQPHWFGTAPLQT